MKAITICQPYAHLICLPDDDDRAKRCENRKWATSYRGPLLIHAGKSRDWLDLDEDKTRDETYGIDLKDMAFGAIIGVCNLVDCVPIKWEINPDTHRGGPICSDAHRRRWPWLIFHEHAEGPFGFVLTECRRFPEPIPYRGGQGFFNVPKEVVEKYLTARA